MAKTHKELEEIKAKCKPLLLQGMNAHQVALAVGCNPATVKKWYPDLVLKNRRDYISEEQQNQIRELRAQNICFREVAEIVNMSLYKIEKYCNSHGLGMTEEQSIIYKSLKVDEVKQRAANHNFTYISGYENYDSIITVKCNDCGTIFERRAILVIRKPDVRKCPHCEEMVKQEREQRRQKEQEQRRQKEQERKQTIKEFESLNNNYIRNIKTAFNIAISNLKKFRPYECKNCGEVFIATQPSSYCSEECKLYHKRYRDYSKAIQKKFKELNREEDVIDKDISLYKVIKRDKGICYLCNKPVDINDYHITAKGAVAVGNNYPSIDHVLPISKGGKHSWDNVGLAHLICNSHKSNNIIDKE